MNDSTDSRKNEAFAAVNTPNWSGTDSPPIKPFFSWKHPLFWDVRAFAGIRSRFIGADLRYSNHKLSSFLFGYLRLLALDPIQILNTACGVFA